MGLLGALIAHDLGVPLVASWHTNVHEFASRRLQKLLGRIPGNGSAPVVQHAETSALALTMRFYQLARMTFAPNPELVELLESRTRRPSFLMQRGIDPDQFSPARRPPPACPFLIGYVGRLSAEKNVRLFVRLDEILRQRGWRDYRFLIVGEGSERSWLQQNLPNADLPGVLQGEALATAYASLDAFVFPSETDTFGNVILEAMASGVPAVVSARGGPKYLVEEGATGFVATHPEAFADRILDLYGDLMRREQMRAAARHAALGRSWSAVFEDVYGQYQRGFQSGVLPSPAPLRPRRHTARSAAPAGHKTFST